MGIDFNNAAKEIVSVLQKHNSVAIIIKGSPDPDAIASSFFFWKICTSLHIKASIVAFMPPSLPSNQEFIRAFNIPLNFVEDIRKINVQHYSGYIICDYQTAFLENIANTIPCIIHLDHHAVAAEDIEAQFRLMTEDVSSTSTLCALIMQHLSILSHEDIQNLSTMLYIGIKTDSNGFSHLSKYDMIALDYIKNFCNIALIEKIENIPLSSDAIEMLQKAMSNVLIYKDWLIAGVGFVEEKYRDTIAIIADHLLERNNVTLVVVYAAVYHKNHSKLDIDASFRTNDENLDLNYLIKSITSNGGGRKFKGAFQVHIDYFVHCPDLQKLWELIEITTTDILKSRRDSNYILLIQSNIKRVKNKIIRMLGLDK